MREVNLEKVAIVLQKPRFPENIGSAARAAANMGISRLVVVQPEVFDREKIMKLATHAVESIVDSMVVCPDLATALSPFQYVIGTTARVGRHRPTTLHPDSLSQKLTPLFANNNIAVVFGPEDRGLSNDELKLCQEVVTIPTAGFHSLNVAQAVMVVCWEFFRIASREDNGDAPPEPAPELASRQDIEYLFEHLQKTLSTIGFLNYENPEHWMRNIRKMFNRFPLRRVDTNLFRGICSQINWYINNRM